MNANEALKASIEKWERNVAQNRTEDLQFGTQSCPLCQEFNDPEGLAPDDCNGCPVYARTGKQYCEGTPYDSVIDYRKGGYRETEVSEGLRLVMQLELEFLRSLETDDVA